MTDQAVLECPNCGGTALEAISEGYRKCEYCGTVLTLPSKTVDVKCPRCGLVNRPDVRYCGECGLALTKWTLGTEHSVDLAVVSILATVVGSFFVPIAGAILGLVLAYRARGQARDTRGASGSEERARIAIFVGWFVMAISVLPICLFSLMAGGQMGFSLCGGFLELPRILLGS